MIISTPHKMQIGILQSLFKILKKQVLNYKFISPPSPKPILSIISGKKRENKEEAYQEDDRQFSPPMTLDIACKH